MAGMPMRLCALGGTLRRLSGRAMAAALLATCCASATAATCSWPDWDAFRRDTISTDGRVVDNSTPQQVTVSEGQAYGLFFALVANDRPTFERLLTWTENNLARGDLASHLPAWIWGRQDAAGHPDRWGVIDSNPASDADLWIAYTLLEAGRLWNERRFTALGTVLARRIASEETAMLPGLGRTVLPGPVGFHPQPNVWRLNPSYVPMQVMRRLAVLLPNDAQWAEMVRTSARMTLDTAPHGFSPDWVEYHAPAAGNAGGKAPAATGFRPDQQTSAESAYNAIRVYLWAGTLSPRDPLHGDLLRTFTPMADYTVRHGHPPERVDTRTGAPGPNAGNGGFSAAVAPLLAALGRQDAAAAQVQRVRSLAARDPLGYYSQVLALFGLGYMDGLYRYDADGALMPAWTTQCPASR